VHDGAKDHRRDHHLDERDESVTKRFELNAERRIDGWRSGSGWNSVGVVSVFNLESSGVEAPERRPRHDKRYHEI
jgi:hypothetical protein